jgi:osmotically-inducible protein OsmY
MSFNDDLTADVNEELFWDPKVDNAAIAVSANDGQITLRGNVGSLREKREAQKATQRVYGVTSVDNQLHVQLMDDQNRADAELRGDVLQALMLDSLVPATIDATATDGYVTLTGTATWQYERDEADYVAANVAGALDVFDEIQITPTTPKADDVQNSITKAFKRNAAFDANDLTITTNNGSVTINGHRALLGRTRRSPRRRLGRPRRHHRLRRHDHHLLTTHLARRHRAAERRHCADRLLGYPRSS